MLGKYEISAKTLENKYQKFWSPADSVFENTKRVLENFCARELLKWAPSMFQRVGKHRGEHEVQLVQKILRNSSISTAEELIHAINKEVKLYEPDSSLLRRMQFICNKLNLPYQIKAEEKGISLEIEVSKALDEHLSNSMQINNPVSLLDINNPVSKEAALSSTLLNSYKKYPLLDQYSDPSTVRQENDDYQQVTITKDPNNLVDGVNYLYVITESGETWFAPQFSKSKKLTHGGLIRKALNISEHMPTPPVLAGGAVVKYQNNFFMNLASGHFTPEVEAYFPTAEILFNKLGKDFTISVQMHHYKSLRVDSCDQLGFVQVANTRSFKLELLDYIGNEYNSPVNRDIAVKLFNAINIAGEKFDADANFDREELQGLFNDEKLIAIVQRYKDFCPEMIQEFNPDDSPTRKFG
ncbi:DUF5617 domain-containing protein [Legionella jamestowniensis]|uniref:RavJ-like C-terminal domain-containing protein n=1 Tax=Legionella jamestowniensis TaxID=455 RepID=A0A0W0UHG0_9GAMM|nr:DUF5617 domain-containing protein [Legionella jamestowniensis]KTD07085.1 hypothetical protein Ljam_1280 [Legionella jamestowniensis]SFL70678.1 hypothetical protein SAMN02746073_1523 [Legionella jamestowniensis DSM 19215]